MCEITDVYFFNRIMTNLVCCKCSSMLVHPIFNCDLGHSYCNECYDTETTCFICGQPCQGSRNHHLEKVCDTLKYHRIYGSRKRTHSEMMFEESSDLLTSIFSCPLSPWCNFRGTKNQLSFHCVLCHGVKNNFDKDLAEIRIPKAPGNISIAFCDAYNSTFIIYAQTDEFTVRFAVSNLSSDESSRFEFIVRMVIDSPDKGERSRRNVLTVGECVNGMKTKKFVWISSIFIGGRGYGDFSVEIVKC